MVFCSVKAVRHIPGVARGGHARVQPESVQDTRRNPCGVDQGLGTFTGDGRPGPREVELRQMVLLGSLRPLQGEAQSVQREDGGVRSTDSLCPQHLHRGAFRVLGTHGWGCGDCPRVADPGMKRHSHFTDEELRP